MQKNGLNADVTTELEAITTAITAMEAGTPVTPLLISVDIDTVTSKAMLKALLDSVYNHVARSNLLT